MRYVFSLVVLFSASVSQAAVTHLYTFNDGTANDSVGAVNGTLVNGASVAGGKLLLANNGTNTDPSTGQYVSLSANILNTRNFSLEVWFTSNGGDAWQRILDLGNKDPANPNNGKGFIILTNNGGSCLGQVSINSWGDASDTDYAAGGSFPVGGEHCLTYVHNLDQAAQQLYLDGNPVGSGAAHVDPSTANYSNFWLGRSQFSQDPFYNGSLDELRTYDSALSGSQVMADYVAGPTVPEPSTFALLAAGLGLAGWVWRRRKRGTAAMVVCVFARAIQGGNQ
jgi:hypothetical protein